MIDIPIKIQENRRDQNGNIICFVKKDGVIKYTNNIPGYKEISFQGKNNTIVIYENDIQPVNCKIICAQNDVFVISHSKYRIKNFTLLSSTQNNMCFIGKNFACAGVHFILKGGTSISIGHDCMFSHDIIIQTSDMHAVIDIHSGSAINPSRSISIGDHVWCGMRATILKGVSIGNNSIIGACSLVSRRFSEEHVVIAGNPAKIVKKDINWDRRSPEALA